MPSSWKEIMAGFVGAMALLLALFGLAKLLELFI